MKDTGEPAFPYFGHTGWSTNCGMTLRDYFAAKAMLGFLASDEASERSAADLARAAYMMADAMLKARQP